ncbi:hypothetical protein C0993_002525 [Termitomyces sp. T159_Od127]|nr:hypothetical protein C0993_002525 [Termitomyces sp. T159_Od127]
MLNQVESSANLVASEALVSGIELLSNSLVDKKPACKIGKVAAVEDDARAVPGPAFLPAKGLIERSTAKELQQRFVQLLKEFSN